jgi:hypothetical protein
MTRKPKSMTKPAATMPKPGPNGAVVRMYRIGHGDCFLIAFASANPDKPVFMMIDCGYKPGSTDKIPGTPKPTVNEIVADIRAVTGGHLDVVVLTHEHQDHLNAITEARFGEFTIGDLWLAWTEDPDDALANQLRKTFRDQLVGLSALQNHLTAMAASGQAASPMEETRRQTLLDRVTSLLQLELGGEVDSDPAASMGIMGDAAFGAAGIGANKAAMKLLKDRAARIHYIRPHEAIVPVPGAQSARAFPLGPPRDETKIRNLDPEESEAFHVGAGAGRLLDLFNMGLNGKGFEKRSEWASPFPSKYGVALARAGDEPGLSDFFAQRYGIEGSPPGPIGDAVADNAAFRRIGDDWLGAAEQLALDLNSYTNNSSLVLAFELSPGGKVLLFAADAQRGNWISWADADFKDGKAVLSARDLLARTVLYKVGHHGSHNATLNGDAGSALPNLHWMGQGPMRTEFTAMITAVRAWAETQKGWNHPLPAIKDALIAKAGGRVLQTDTDLTAMEPPRGAERDWAAFMSRTTGTRLYFDLVLAP